LTEIFRNEVLMRWTLNEAYIPRIVPDIGKALIAENQKIVTGNLPCKNIFSQGLNRFKERLEKNGAIK